MDELDLLKLRKCIQIIHGDCPDEWGMENLEDCILDCTICWRLAIDKKLKEMGETNE